MTCTKPNKNNSNTTVEYEIKKYYKNVTMRKNYISRINTHRGWLSTDFDAKEIESILLVFQQIEVKRHRFVCKI